MLSGTSAPLVRRRGIQQTVLLARWTTSSPHSGTGGIPGSAEGDVFDAGACNRPSRWSGRARTSRCKGTHTEAPAGGLRPALLEEPLPDLGTLLLALALQLLAPARAPHEELLEPHRADGRKAALSRPIGDGHDAALLEDVVSGVMPKPWVRFGPAWERPSAERSSAAPRGAARSNEATRRSAAQRGAARRSKDKEQRGAAWSNARGKKAARTQLQN